MPRNKTFLYISPVRDAELLAFLAGLDNKSAYIRDAIYEKMARDKGQPATRAATQAESDLARVVSAVRQAVRDELLIARLAPAATQNCPDPDGDRRREAQSKLTELFSAWDDDHEEDTS